jgi:PIN domain nuclease of toxin-antitoxin system
VKDVLLDTHVWIWVSVEDKTLLSGKAKRLLRQAGQKWISAISCWELAKLVEKKRIAFSIPLVIWMRRSINEFSINIADLSPEIAVESTQLKDFHNDPADQIIAATSRVLGMALLTSDKRILEHTGVKTVSYS